MDPHPFFVNSFGRFQFHFPLRELSRVGDLSYRISVSLRIERIKELDVKRRFRLSAVMRRVTNALQESSLIVMAVRDSIWFRALHLSLSVNKGHHSKGNCVLTTSRWLYVIRLSLSSL